MSKVISVTIPGPCVDDLQTAANKIGISRSRFISNMLLSWQADQLKPENKGDVAAPNDCPHRDSEDGTCAKEGHVCDAPQFEAITCAMYPGRKSD